MMREDIEKAGVDEGSSGLEMAAGKRKILKREHVETQTAGVQNRTAHAARRFYALHADWYTNSIVGRGDSPASIRRRARA